MIGVQTSGKQVRAPENNTRIAGQAWQYIPKISKIFPEKQLLIYVLNDDQFIRNNYVTATQILSPSFCYQKHMKCLAAQAGYHINDRLYSAVTRKIAPS